MRIALLAVFLGLGFLSVSAAPATPETFIAAIQQAIAAKSTDQLLALTYTAGLSDAENSRPPPSTKCCCSAIPSQA